MKTINSFFYFSVFASLFLTSCEPVPDDLFVRTFIIKKGEHYSTPRLVEALQSDRLIFTAIFDESAMYDHNDAAQQTNKNKLLGFSDCNSTHHQNSARFAWQWYNNRLEIFAYCYVDGERFENFIGTVEINEVNRYEIRLTELNYVFILNDETSVVMPRGNHCNTGTYYMLWPYFGGTLPAPQDVRIDVSIQR
jgi:hypothetical protein